MIKARYCAGDARLARAFLQGLAPFIWRRSLDYEAQNDIRSLLGQIQRIGERTQIKAAGAHVKLGRGGIREIEFLLQIQQLLFGGRELLLRDNRTVEMLQFLPVLGICSRKTSDELVEDYYFLRAIEHRLQMRHDAQTHLVPEEDRERELIAQMMGYEQLEKFDEALERSMARVHAHMVEIYGDAQSLDSDYGNLVFTGVDPDPDTLRSLAEMGFSDPAAIFTIISNWHRGEAPLARSERGRQILTLLIPKLLEDCAGTGRPDDSFHHFRQLIEKIDNESLRFGSLLLSEQKHRENLLDVFSAAPRLARIAVKRPYVVDVLFDQQLSQSLGSVAEAGRKALLSRMTRDLPAEAVFDQIRRFRREHGFSIGANLLLDRINAVDASQHFTDVAQLCVEAVLKQLENTLYPETGMPFDYAIFAMGKLGGYELMAASDLDMIFVYDDHGTDAAREAAAFVSQFITVMAQPSSSGTVFSVDLQLRPYGSDGPKATKISSLRNYYREGADFWEYMALTRARALIGSLALMKNLEILRNKALTEDFTPRKFDLKAEAAKMRGKIRENRAALSRWDLKLAAGGLFDIEFITQLLQLEQKIFDPNTMLALEKLRNNDSSRQDICRQLYEAYRLQFGLSQHIRLAFGKQFTLSDCPPVLLQRLCKSAQVAGSMALEGKLLKTQNNVTKIFDQLLDWHIL